MKKLIENRYYIWISGLQCLNIKKLNILLEKYQTLENIYNINKEQLKSDFKNNSFITENIIEKISNQKFKERIDKTINNLENYHIGFISYKDYEYSKKLKEIYDFPIGLYYKGNINLLNNNQIKLSMIGCREYSEYGKENAIQFAYELSRKGVIITSGLARGIDSFSHIGTLKAKKETIAVLGNGIDYIYPPENKKLEEQILANNGLIISEYIIGTKPSKYTFPARNRIISGLSDGVFVLEAKERSGTLITVDFALEQGKNIYVLPGNITNKNSYGTNELIKQGAKVVTKVEDITEDYNLNI